MHLLSQIILSNSQLYSSGSLIYQEERNKFLPPSRVMSEIVKKLCIQIAGEKDTVSKVLQSKNENKAKKHLLQKYFFFNYLLSVTLPDIMQISLNATLNG